MKGDIELVSDQGVVMGEGRVGEFVYVERGGVAHTLAIEWDDELVLSRMANGPPGLFQVSATALDMLLQ